MDSGNLAINLFLLGILLISAIAVGFFWRPEIGRMEIFRLRRSRKSNIINAVIVAAIIFCGFAIIKLILDHQSESTVISRMLSKDLWALKKPAFPEYPPFRTETVNRDTGLAKKDASMGSTGDGATIDISNVKKSIQQCKSEDRKLKDCSQMEDLKHYLFSAVIESDETLISDYLLQRGLSPNVTNDDGRTPLMFAVFKNNFRQVKLLIRYGANMSARDNMKCSVLYYALLGGNAEISSYLIKRGARLDNDGKESNELLIIAASKAKSQLASQLFNYFPKLDVNAKDIHGRSALIYACDSKSIEIVKVLIANGADINFTDNEQNNCLYAATVNNNENLVTLLLSLEDPPKLEARTLFTAFDQKGSRRILEAFVQHYDTSELLDSSDRNILMYATYRGDQDLIDRLIAKKETLDKKDKYNLSAIQYGINAHQNTIVSRLIDAGANLDSKDNYGRSILHYICARGEKRLLEQIIKRKADLNLGDKDLNTPAKYALANDQYKTLELLLQSDIKLDSADSAGRTLLVYAAASGDHQIANLLIRKRASLDQTDNTGNNAMTYAYAANNTSIMNLLIENGATLRANTTAQKQFLKDILRKSSKPRIN